MGNLSDIGIDQKAEPGAAPDYELIPDGWYIGSLKKAEVKPTSAGDGYGMNAQFQILQEPYVGRIVFHYFFLKSTDGKKDPKIGLGQLSALARACGFMAIPDNDYEMYEIPISLKIGKGKASGVNPETKQPYPPKNEVKDFKKLDKNVPAARPAPARVTQAAEAAAEISSEAAVSFEDDDIPF